MGCMLLCRLQLQLERLKLIKNLERYVGWIKIPEGQIWPVWLDLDTGGFVLQFYQFEQNDRNETLLLER